MVQLNSKFQDFVSDPNRRRLYERESLIFDASELLSELMDKKQINKAKLAEMAGTSKPHITSLLSGSRNMTLSTFADLAFVLGHRVEINACPLTSTSWIDTGFQVHDWHKPPETFWDRSSIGQFSSRELPETEFDDCAMGA